MIITIDLANTKNVNGYGEKTIMEQVTLQSSGFYDYQDDLNIGDILDSNGVHD